MPGAKYSREEVATRGEAIYEREIRHKVESQSKGQYLVLDIETGEYEINPDDLVATKQAMAKRPDAVLYGLRIGYPAAYRLGCLQKYSERSAVPQQAFVAQNWAMAKPLKWTFLW